jgi:hypothetical protein
MIITRLGLEKPWRSAALCTALMIAATIVVISTRSIGRSNTAIAGGFEGSRMI